MSIVTSHRDGAAITITMDRAQDGNLLTVDGVRERRARSAPPAPATPR